MDLEQSLTARDQISTHAARGSVVTAAQEVPGLAAAGPEAAGMIAEVPPEIVGEPLA